MFTVIGQLSTRAISLFHSFQLYLVAKDTILYLLSLFDERREQKKLSRRMVFVVERNEDVVLLRARARPKAFARLIMEKMTCTEKRR